jgi:fibronectin type 3 domain-containing protein
VTVSAATLTGTGFTVSGLTFPLTLTSGQTATLEVQFKPVVASSATGQLTITSNSSTNSTATISLSGTGTASSYSVNLSWDPPTSSTYPVAGYNIYRAPGGSTTYALLNSSTDTATSYVDSTVVSGQSYNYIAQSVYALGAESNPSNLISVSIP